MEVPGYLGHLWETAVSHNKKRLSIRSLLPGTDGSENGSLILFSLAITRWCKGVANIPPILTLGHLRRHHNLVPGDRSSDGGDKRGCFKMRKDCIQRQGECLGIGKWNVLVVLERKI